MCAFETGKELTGGCTSTNHNGEYTVSGLAEANYTVEFIAEVCGGSGCTQQNYLTQFFEGKSLYSEATPVAVHAGKATEKIDAKMVEGGQISGTVTKAAGGAPIEGIEVCAEGVGAIVDFGNCASTNAAGGYLIPGLSTGEYTVEFYAYSENYLTQYYNGQSELAKAQHVSVTVGKTTEKIEAKMAQGGQIAGRVTDASTHAPLGDVEVCADDESDIELDICETTNSNGEYTISRLPTASYDVNFYAESESANYLPQGDGGVHVVAGDPPSSVNAELRPGGEITGRVTDASTHAGLAKIDVCAEALGGNVERCALTSTGDTSATATSNAVSVPGGSFTLVKAPVFDVKTDELDFFFAFPTAGTLRWSLFFDNADVGFADSLGISLGDSGALAETARKKGKAKSKKCKQGTVRHKGKCASLLVPFASGSQSVPAGTVEVKVHADSKAVKALKAGHTLHVSGTFTFQAPGGPAVAHSESTVVRLSKKAAKKHSKHKKPRK